MRIRCAKFGFTLVEVLVCIGVVAILLGLLLPAVNNVREKARTGACWSNLRQLGVAMHNYLADSGVFPSAAYANGVIPGLPQSSDCVFSPLCGILPYLDNSVVFDGINFSQNSIGGSNATVANTVVGIFLCPSDGETPIARQPTNEVTVDVRGHNSYRVNLGPSVGLGFLADSRKGAFTMSDWHGAAAFADGLSNTALMSEKLRGDGDRSRFRLDRHWRVQQPYQGHGLVQTDLFVSLCNDPQFTLYHRASYGASWFMSGFISTWYNHAIEPNASVPDCVLGDGGEWGFGPVQPRVCGARSLHGSAVNVLYADGAVGSVGSQIDRRIWRSVATRNNND